MDADSIRIETDEDGFWLEVKPEGAAEYRFRITDPEALYDHVKAAIGPWLRERDEARREWDEMTPEQRQYVHEGVALDVERYGHVASWREPIYHSVHIDLMDARTDK